MTRRSRAGSKAARERLCSGVPVIAIALAVLARDGRECFPIPKDDEPKDDEVDFPFVGIADADSVFGTRLTERLSEQPAWLWSSRSP